MLQDQAARTGLTVSTVARNIVEQALRREPSKPSERTDRERFEANVLMSDDSSCWPWNSAKDTKKEYRFWLSGRLVSIQNAAYEIYFGKVPYGNRPWQRCGNHACANPRHIVLRLIGKRKTR